LDKEFPLLEENDFIFIEKEEQKDEEEDEIILNPKNLSKIEHSNESFNHNGVISSAKKLKTGRLIKETVKFINECTTSKSPVKSCRINPFKSPSSQRYKKFTTSDSNEELFNPDIEGQKSSLSNIIIPIIQPKTYQDYGFVERCATFENPPDDQTISNKVGNRNTYSIH